MKIRRREGLLSRCPRLMLFVWVAMFMAGWSFAGELEYNTNRFGGDYTHLVLSKPDPKLCQEECQKDDRCKAFTYVKPGVQDENAVCWLKYTVPPKSYDTNCVSGVKDTEETGSAEGKTTGLEYNTNRPGYDYRFIVMQNPVPELCAIECARDPRCKAFTYVKPGIQGVNARCWLKDQESYPEPDPNCISGLKGAVSEESVQGKIEEKIAVENPEWLKPTSIVRSGKEAELVVRVGDIDNFGFGWPKGFDPFSGESTPPHGYPWTPGPDDPSGTDRIMVVSSYNGNPSYGEDGYTFTTRRPDNLPQPIQIDYSLGSTVVHSARLQMFVDDFQAPVHHTRFQVMLDGQRAFFIEDVLNNLDQTGPIGKLISVEILPEYLNLLNDGHLTIEIDDPTTGAGDGFAIDFVRLLINPGESKNAGTIVGRVLDSNTGKPIAGALVSASGVVEAETDTSGSYRLPGVPAGLVVLKASASKYDSAVKTMDLLRGQSLRVDFRLKLRPKESTAFIARELREKGRASLYGIYFDVDSAKLKPSSQSTLQAILTLLREQPTLRLEIEGHTDSTASAEYNLRLSLRRAQAVRDWLVAHGVSPSRLSVRGYGESRPIADNGTPAGRALNRRVEVVAR